MKVKIIISVLIVFIVLMVCVYYYPKVLYVFKLNRNKLLKSLLKIFVNRLFMV